MLRTNLNSEKTGVWPYEMLIPEFAPDRCENCFGVLKRDRAHLNRHINRGGIQIVMMNAICDDCLDEVISRRKLIRNVSDMTKDLIQG